MNRGPRATARTESRTSSHAVEARSSFSSCRPTTSPAKGDNPATASVSVLGLNPDVHVFWLEASEGALHNFRRQRPDGANRAQRRTYTHKVSSFLAPRLSQHRSVQQGLVESCACEFRLNFAGGIACRRPTGFSELLCKASEQHALLHGCSQSSSSASNLILRERELPKHAETCHRNVHACQCTKLSRFVKNSVHATFPQRSTHSTVARES